MNRLSNDERRDLVQDVAAAKTGSLNPTQIDALFGLLGRVSATEARSAVRHALLADRFQFGSLLDALRAAAKAHDDPDKPFHPLTCSGGCEGGGWVPGPNQQARMTAAGETVALARCPAGPEMTQAVWDGIRAQQQAWSGDREIDMAALVADAKITHRLPGTAT